jgi:hypothetical protein
MASADEGDLLTYANISDLFSLIDDHWSLFEAYLPPRQRWVGRTDELRELRNRNAHCRRPHSDDVARVEQTLRDLERGAQAFYSAYANTRFIPEASDDPVAKAWIRGEHDTARRLLGHAANQYEVRFQLAFTVRPWAVIPDVDAIAGSEGAFWYAQWYLGPLEAEPTRLWRDLERLPSSADLIVHLIPDSSSVVATFSALEPPDRIADAIGNIFDLILMTSRPRMGGFDLDDIQSELDARRAEVARLPARVQMTTAFTLMDPHEPDAFTIFAAGA